jgi:hypothetical protein
MEQKLPAAKTMDDERIRAAVAEALGRPQREVSRFRHQPPTRFRRNEAVPVRIAVLGKAATVRLCYRHVNQAERWESAEMQLQSGIYRGSIPAAYTEAHFPLQYYFEVEESAEVAWFYPGFDRDLANQPYFVVERG